MTKQDRLEALVARNYALVTESVSIKQKILDDTIPAYTRRVYLESYADIMLQIGANTAERVAVSNEPADKKSILARITRK